MRRPRLAACEGDGALGFELKEDLPPGSYVAYSSADPSDGAAESNFTAEDGNLKTFKVR